MDYSTLGLFIPACFALNMAPGPNNLLSLNDASRYGLRTACAAGLIVILNFRPRTKDRIFYREKF